MVRTSLKIASMALAAVLTFTGMGINAQAAGVSSVLPTGGINITLAQGTSLESLQQGDSTAKIEALLDEAALQQAREEAGIEVTPNEEDELKSLVIAQVNNYVNVRSLPSEEGEILGKLYNNSVGTFIQEENGWYLISSGTVTGYVKGEYCVTGEAAIDLAKQVSTRIATVNTETLKVRNEPSMEASVLTLVPYQDDLVVPKRLTAG